MDIAERTRLLDETDEECILDNRNDDVGSSRENTADRLSGFQSQLNDVVSVMKDNVNKVLQRGENLDSLQGRSAALSIHADEFQRSARRTARTIWWQNTKMVVIFGGAMFVLLLIIVVSLVTRNNSL